MYGLRLISELVLAPPNKNMPSTSSEKSKKKGGKSRKISAAAASADLVAEKMARVIEVLCSVIDAPFNSPYSCRYYLLPVYFDPFLTLSSSQIHSCGGRETHRKIYHEERQIHYSDLPFELRFSRNSTLFSLQIPNCDFSFS